MNDLSKVYDMGFIVDTPPAFMRGALGPYVRFSDGKIHYLTFLERIQRFLYRITADDFQEMLRPALVHDIKAYKQSKVYNNCVNQIPLKLVVPTGIANGDVLIVGDVLRDCMKYFVWIKTNKNPVPQLWAYDHTSSSLSGKIYSKNVLRKEELIGQQQFMTLDELVNIYPCPEVNDEC